MSKTERVPACELVEDFDLLSREHVDSTHVAHLAVAYRAGEDVPPIIADRKTRCVADGVHRKRAQVLNANGDGSVLVEVEWRDFASKEDMFLFSATRNARHGKGLTTYDRTRCAIVARRLGIAQDQLAKALAISVEMVRALFREQTAGSESTPGRIALKRPFLPMAGQELTPAQEEVVRHSNGMRLSYHIREIIGRLKEGMVFEKDNEALHAQLRELVKTVREYLKEN